MTGSASGSTKFQGSNDYKIWRGDVRMIIRAGNPVTTWTRTRTAEQALRAARAAWLEKAEAKTKSTIVLNLGPVVKVRVRVYIDPDDA